jgi:GTPase
MAAVAPFRSGFVALVGRPNSGKSTLLNTVLGQELSPVTPLPQTTRHRIMGVYSRPGLQIVFIDTPGIHRGGRPINQAMLREARDAAADEGVDCLCYLVDLSRDVGEEEALVAAIAESARAPVLVIFNKKDLCTAVEQRRKRFFSQFPGLVGAPSITLCAKDAAARDSLLAALERFIKEGPRYYDDDALTNADMRFFAAEFLRKQIILATSDEVPHAVFVEIEKYREGENRHDIGALIHVETIGQKGIVIGKKGALINRMRHAAEKELGRLAGCPVSLSCHVVVTPHWRDDRTFLASAYPASGHSRKSPLQ